MKKVFLLLLFVSMSLSSLVMSMEQPQATGKELELFQAIEKNNIARVKELIEEDVDVSERIYKGQQLTPLEFSFSKKEIADYLKEAIGNKFLKAVREDDINTVKAIGKSFLKYSDIRDDTGNTPLMLAAQRGNIEMVQELLAIGMMKYIAAQNNHRETALMLAINAKNSDIIKILLNNMDLDIDGKLVITILPYPTLLELAVKTGDPKTVEAILTEGPNPSSAMNLVQNISDLNARDKIRKLLEQAQKQYNFYKEIFYGKLNLDSSITDFLKTEIQNRHRNPLTTAILTQQFPRINFLLAEGIKVNKDFINQKLKFGVTPLMYAIDIGDVGIIKLLLEKGANPLLKNSEGKTARDIAQEKVEKVSGDKKNDYEQIIQLLKEKEEIFKNANSPSNQTDNNQKIFLEAVQNGDLANIKNLIGKVNVNVQNAEGDTALMLAVAADKPEIVEFIIAQGADINQVNANPADKYKDTALNIAVSAKNLEMVKLLTQKGANINQQTKHAYIPNMDSINTPLINAVENSTPKIVEYLLEKGANPNVTNEMDESPIYLAYENFDLENIKSLVKYGAHINYQVHTPLRAGANDITILMKAAASGKVDRVKELLALGANPFLKNSEGKSAIALVSDKQNAYQGDVSPAGLATKKDLREIYQLLKSASGVQLLSYVKTFEQTLKALQFVILKRSA